MGGEKCESGERREVQARSTVASTVSKARSRSREVVTLDEEPRISLRVSTKLPSSSSSSMSTVIISWYAPAGEKCFYTGIDCACTPRFMASLHECPRCTLGVSSSTLFSSPLSWYGPAGEKCYYTGMPNYSVIFRRECSGGRCYLCDGQWGCRACWLGQAVAFCLCRHTASQIVFNEAS